jgi:hypothetical protein
MEITWHPESRVATVRFTTEVSLTGQHGSALADALERWTATRPEPFALLADAKRVTGTNGDYRAATGRFFGDHRHTARIAVINMSPVIRVVAEMFRVGMRLQMRTFADEAAARAWLRAQGIAA